jgi:DNA-binding NarL/FixJ family response regulator
MAKLRVLIASDDDDMRKEMVVLLCRNYQVVGAVTNRELVQAATNVRPDVIVSGISTPGMDGLAARKKLITQGTLIPFVFVSRDNSEEIINLLWKERSFAFVYKEETSTHLVNAVEAVHNLAIYDSPFYPHFSEQQLADQKIVLVGQETLRKAERMIRSCEMCNTEADVLFSEILDRLIGADPDVTDYLLEKPGSCPTCYRAITEKTFVEPFDRL